MRYIDDFLNNITMYRLTLYFLIVLASISLIYAFFGLLPFGFLELLFSFAVLISVGFIFNKIFAIVFEAPTNIESFWISALILGLIISPPKNTSEIIFLAWVSILAMASKFIFAINKKHLFNPVAIAVVLTALFIGKSATWWIGDSAMLPFTLVGGFLIIRKIKRWDMVLSFLVSSSFFIFLTSVLSSKNPFPLFWREVTDTPLIFFSSIMLSEPQTSPPTKILRVLYGAFVGFLFTPQIHFGTIYITPEIALVIGNVFNYLVSPRYKLILTLKQKVQLSHDTFDFVFALSKPLKFTPGQYMEFTFEHPKADSRGNRRYFSLASSPTENELRIGVKFENPTSSYKRNLLGISPNQKIVASQLIGDFVLPKDKDKKLVLIAGGIGITPFRSMIKYLTDANEKRDIVIVYTASNIDDFVYKNVFEEAVSKLGISIYYLDTKNKGRLDATKLIEFVPDYKTRTYYVSGSHGVVTAIEEILHFLDVPRPQIVTDYFPGFA